MSDQEFQERVVIIVGAGPAGLATAACLTKQSIPFMVLEREDCYAPLWQKLTYDRLHLHLPKIMCQLPHFPVPSNYSTFMSKSQFISYLHSYVSHFNINPLFKRLVVLARYDDEFGKWRVKVKNGDTGEVEEYRCRFLVVATGETTDPFVPEIDGIKSFDGEVIHTTQYKNGRGYDGKNVLVVGSGNSGMEIALDLVNHRVKTSIVVRSPMHILSKEMVLIVFVLLRWLPFHIIDALLAILGKLVYGTDLTKYGITRPKESPFFLKDKYGKYPIMNAGTIQKIKSGEIRVLPAVRRISGSEVMFENGNSHPFDVIIFATGFKRSTNQWLKGEDYLLNEDGLPKLSFPNHWKGKNGLYCSGLGRNGLYGIYADVQNIADNIKLFPL